MASDRLPRMTEDDAVELRAFIRNYVESSGSAGAVVGFSGGIDSAVVAKLAVDALGPENVHAVFMPTDVTSKADYGCTEKMASAWGMKLETLNIQPVMDAYFGLLGHDLSRLDTGNLMARCRMSILYEKAKTLKCIVLGTSNQSEFMMGYFTKYGDGAADALPLVKMYKTNVRQLAKIIGIPQEVVDKAPSAGLWEGQTDEGEMGVSYDDLDMVLYGIEHGKTDAEISHQYGVPEEKVSEIRERVESMAHKRIPAARPGKTF